MKQCYKEAVEISNKIHEKLHKINGDMKFDSQVYTNRKYVEKSVKNVKNFPRKYTDMIVKLDDMLSKAFREKYVITESDIAEIKNALPDILKALTVK